MSTRARFALAMTAVSVLAACGPFGGGDDAKDSSTKPDAPSELARTPVPAGGDLPHWTYEGAEGPEFWGDLAEDWAACEAGEQQSPIDIAEAERFVAESPTTTEAPQESTTTATTKKPKATTTTAEAEPTTTTEAPWPGAPAEQEIDFKYQRSAFTVVDNGHTVQVNLDDAGAMVIDGVAFQLVQFHFHTPSEHTLSGAAYPLEYHLVHKSEAGELAVVGVLIQRGAENETLAPIFDDLPKTGETIEGTDPIDPRELLPENRTMVRYNGSLTTPPCAERVRWHLMLTPKQMSKLQIARFAARHPDSRRPVQEVGDRTVVVEIDREAQVKGVKAEAADHDADASHGSTTDAESHAETPDGAHAETPDGAHAEPATGGDDHPTTVAATDEHATADGGH